MSIAADEAERRYPIEYSNFDCDVSKLSACRRAFALGAEWQSQREPTEAEVEAAAKAMYWHYASYETDGTVDYKEAMKRYDGMLWRGIVSAGWAAACKAITK